LIFNEDIKGCIERLPFKEMVLLHVVEPLLPPEAKGEEMKNKVKSAEEFLNNVKSKLERDVDILVEIGDPAKVILITVLTPLFVNTFLLSMYPFFSSLER
jgi:hypothetical protein